MAGAADLVEAIMRHILQHDGLHGEHVGKLHLRDVEGTHHVGPTWGSGGQASGKPETPHSPTLQAVPSSMAFPSDSSASQEREIQHPPYTDTHVCPPAFPDPAQGGLLTSADGPPLTSIVGPLQCPVFVWAQLTPLPMQGGTGIEEGLFKGGGDLLTRLQAQRARGGNDQLSRGE